MSEFSPSQLDRIEDALEELEALGVPSELLDGSQAERAAAQRLDEYRELLTLTREAMPLQEVPEGVLDRVLAQARESTVAEVATSATADQAGPTAKGGASKSWWERFRLSLLVPALAVAGGAALVLIIVAPLGNDQEPARDGAVAKSEPATAREGDRPRPAPPPPEPAAAAEQRLADASDQAQADKFEQGQRGEGALGLNAEVDAEQEEAVDEDIAYQEVSPASTPTGSSEADDSARRSRIERKNKKTSAAKSSSPSSRSAGGAPGKGGALPKAPPPSQEPKPEPSPQQAKDDPAPTPAPDDDTPDPWLLIEEGDKLRRSGQCSMAGKKYQQAKLSANRSVRARALAGLGLCEQKAGQSGAAEELFEQARALDSSVGGFIEKGG